MDKLSRIQFNWMELDGGWRMEDGGGGGGGVSRGSSLNSLSDPAACGLKVFEFVHSCFSSSVKFGSSTMGVARFSPHHLDFETLES